MRDLIARIPNTEVASAADIGCGPGNSTEVLRDRYPRGYIVGMDSSADMIGAARRAPFGHRLRGRGHSGVADGAGLRCSSPTPCSNGFRATRRFCLR